MLSVTSSFFALLGIVGSPVKPGVITSKASSLIIPLTLRNSPTSRSNPDSHPSRKAGKPFPVSINQGAGEPSSPHTTSTGTTTVCVTTLAVNPATPLVIPAAVDSGTPSLRVSLATKLLVRSSVLMYTMRAGRLPKMVVPKPWELCE